MACRTDPAEPSSTETLRPAGELRALITSANDAIATADAAQLAIVESRANVARLIAGILHEVNSPLGATRSACDTLTRMLGTAERSASVDRMAAIAGVIQDGVDRIDQVVEVLERILRSSERALDRVDAAQCMCQVVRRLALTVSLGTRIRVSLPPPGVMVQASRTQLLHIFRCLLDNAAASIDGAGEIRVSVRATDTTVLVRFSDSGRGMSEAQVRAAYQFGFTQRNGRMRLRTGLATVKSAVDAMGGAIRLSSRRGEGTHVRLRLPRA